MRACVNFSLLSGISSNSTSSSFTGFGFFSSDLGSMGNSHSGMAMGVPGATAGAAGGGSSGMTLWAMAAFMNNAAQRMLMPFNS